MRRIWFFRTVVALVGPVLIVAFELSLQMWSDLNPPPLVIELGRDKGQALKSINSEYASRFFFQRHDGQLIASGDMAPRPFVDPRGTKPLRIVFVGASTVQGYPQPSRLSAASFLQAMLEDAYPEHPVEVFGLGIVAIASFAVGEVLKDALSILKPDIAVVYTGHNEFMGVYGIKSHPWFNRFHYNTFQFRLPRLARWVVESVRGAALSNQNLLEILASRSQFSVDDPRRELARDYLLSNLDQMQRYCQEVGVPFVLCTLVSNDTGFAPAGTRTPDLAPQALGEWQRALDAIAVKVTTGGGMYGREHGRVLRELESLLTQAPKNAWVWYLRARVLQSMGRDQEAFVAFLRARDLDTMPWRAPTGHNRAIRSLATQTGGFLADVEVAFRTEAPAAGIGWELMDDHVHPSVRGQALLARTVAETVVPLVGGKLNRIGGDESYFSQLGYLSVERVRTDRAMGRLLSEPPMHQYNGHNAEAFHERAMLGWEGLMESERVGALAWRKTNRSVPLVLEVADRLFEAERFADAGRHYAASRIEAPYTPRGDLWASVQWGWCRLLQGKEISAFDGKILREALRRVDFVSQAPDIEPAFVDFVRGQLHYLLGEHTAALMHLEQAANHPEFRRQFAFNLFPPLADELVRSGRHREAQHYAHTMSQDRGGDDYFVDLVDSLIAGNPLISGGRK